MTDTLRSNLIEWADEHYPLLREAEACKALAAIVTARDEEVRALVERILSRYRELRIEEAPITADYEIAAWHGELDALLTGGESGQGRDEGEGSKCR